MDNTAYLALSRLSGLRKEMDAVANNIANMTTTGFRREGVVFAEFIKALPVEGGSVSMTEARIRRTDLQTGGMERTGGRLDLAIDGPGYFLIGTPDGLRLTRAGAFRADAAGTLVTASGETVMDAGGAPVLLPAGSDDVLIEADGAVLTQGREVGRIALVDVADPSTLTRMDGVRFAFEGDLQPAGGTIAQGFIEGSNVSPVAEMTRMIDVHRAYELGQALLDREDERVREAVRTLGRPV